jgi:hypothetical protein
MADQATLTPPADIQDDVDPFREQLLSTVNGTEPAAVEAPTPPVTPPVETPPAAVTPPPAVTGDDRPRGADGKFLPKEEPTAPAETPAPAAPKENLLDKLSKGEIDEIPAKPSGTNPGMRPAEGTEEFNTWREQANALKETRKQLEEARAQIKEVQGKVPADYEEIRKRAEEAEAREAARDVRARPEFQRDYAQPIRSIGQSIEGILKDRGFSNHKIGEIIQIDDDVKRDNELTEYLSSGENPLPATTIARVGLQIERLRELRREADEVIKNAPQIMDTLKQEDEATKQREVEEQKQLYDKGKGLVFQVFEREFGDIMKNEKSRAQVEQAASRNWDDLKPAQRALAMASPAMVQEIQAAWEEDRRENAAKLADSAKENASLRLQLSRLGGGGPTVEPKTTPTPQEDPDGDPFAAKLFNGQR